MKNPPSRIRKARIEGDTSYLKAAGRRGGIVAAQNRDSQRVMRERIIEQRAQDEQIRSIDANEHIIPLETYE